MLILLLQSRYYADDSMVFREPCGENLWSIKAILWSFELVSGLRVNFNKSKLFGINVPANLLEGHLLFLIVLLQQCLLNFFVFL